MKLKKTNKKILFIAYKHFEADPRPQREAAALLDRGYEIDIICIKPEFTNFESLQKENIKLYPIKIKKARSTKLRYLYEYFTFFFFASFKTLKLYLKNKYPLIQIFVMPEFLVLGCLFPKLFGAKILMDWEDPSIEVFQTIFNKQKSTLLNFIYFFEKIAVSLSNKVITPNLGFKKAFVKRGLSDSKIDIIMNLPDKRIFKLSETVPSRKPVKPNYLLYNGSIIHRHGLDIGIEAMTYISKELPYLQLHVLGEGHNSEYHLQCIAMAEKLNLNENIKWMDLVSINKIPKILTEAACMIVTNRDTPFTRINLPTRIMEAGILGVPVVAPKLLGILDYFDDSEIALYEPDDPKDMANKIIELLQSKEKQAAMIKNNFKKCSQMCWEEEYIQIIENLIQTRS